jgi:hypothetical protein
MLTRIFSHPRFLVLYSATVTLAFIATVYLGFIKPVHGASSATEFDRIRVHRIDVVEPDGTPRLIIADRAEYPGSFFHGREVKRSDRNDVAGMLMINDEGTEDGGLIFGGETKDGKRSSFSHLSFDQYEQDQTLVLGASLSPNGEKTSGVTVNDMPDKPITPDLMIEAEQIKTMPQGPAKDTAWATFLKKYPKGQQRATLRRAEDGSVGLILRDKEGRPRLQLTVADDGSPAIQLLDAKGKVRRSITTDHLLNQ